MICSGEVEIKRYVGRLRTTKLYDWLELKLHASLT
jgi:hypothetical protein